MGTVTAIGEYDPNDGYTQPLRQYGTNATTATSLTTVIGTRASITFDQWETAIGAAMVAARTACGVKVNKVGSEWVVSWDTPVTYNPTPTYYPPTWWQNPYVTFPVTNGDTA